MSWNFIDISNHQSTIRIANVPTDAVIVKATEGRGWRDKSMPGFVAQARSADKPLGFYHFVSQGNTPAQEADNFLAYTEGHRRGNDVIVLDWEPLGSNPSNRNVDWAVRWLEHVSARAPNPIWTYMNQSTANASNWKPVTSRWPLLWLAMYPGSNKANGYNPAGSRGHLDGANGWQLAAWQFTDGGRLSGFGGNLDLNELYIPWWEGQPSGGGGGGATVIVPEIPAIHENDPKVWIDTPNSAKRSGGWGCICMKLTIPLVDEEMRRRRLVKRGVDYYQFGYAPYGPNSLDYHGMGGVVDVVQGISLEERQVWAMFGWIMAPRVPEWGYRNTASSPAHGHGGMYGCVHRMRSLAKQVEDMMDGRNGLKSNLRVNWEKPTRTWQEAYREYAAETITIREEEEEPMATPQVRTLTIHHPGGEHPVLPGDAHKALDTTATAVTGVARATLTAPEGVKLRTRWVSWSGRDDVGWVRDTILDHATNSVETTAIIDQAWGGADFQLDVYASEECTIDIVLSSLTTPKR